jgi:hypothetical protein
MEEGSSQIDLFAATQKIEIQFLKMVTVRDFVKDLKARRLRLLENKNIDLIPNFKSVFHFYENQLNMSTNLYTFNLRYKDSNWKFDN